MLRTDLKKRHLRAAAVEHYTRERRCTTQRSPNIVEHLPSKCVEKTGCNDGRAGLGQVPVHPRHHRQGHRRGAGRADRPLHRLADRLDADGDRHADPNQRRLMLLLPLVIVAFLFRYPAGLLVYWITTNCWTIGQQYFIRRRIGPPPAEGRRSRGGDRANGRPASAPRAPRWLAPARWRQAAAHGARRRAAALAAQEEEALGQAAMSDEDQPRPTARRRGRRAGAGGGARGAARGDRRRAGPRRRGRGAGGGRRAAGAACEARTSACSSAAAGRRSTPSSTWPSGSCSARARRRCGS